MLDMEDISLAECQQYLLNLTDPDTPALGEMLSERDLHNIIAQCKIWSTVEFSADERVVIPKFVAKTLSTMINSTSIEGKYWLKLCT
jgi:hypothetical protein